MKVKIASAQYPIVEHKTFDEWHQHLEEWIAGAAKEGAQLLLFPEYGSLDLLPLLPEEAGLMNVREQIKAMDTLRGDFCSAFAELAGKYNVAIVAPSFPVQEEGNVLNRAYVFSSKGMVGYQDKFFTTRFEAEDWGVGRAPKVLTLFEAPWGSFGIQICYDVEFALGSKLLASEGASLILAPSCTETIRGSSRVHIGARARALETQAFSIVSQTVGDAPESTAVPVNYGQAACYCAPVLDMPERGIMEKMMPQVPGWLFQSPDLAEIEKLRNEGRVFNFKDQQRFYADFPDEEVKVIRKQL
ncbi:carbon-nitrogen hydrolase family protein [Nafulsella turpanensis]|uniref:carbon-nitrogen hydrolase family protein n=1 Tax=Nafulsella turpanensis TaxID=1265690 RepID=UPI00034C5DD8|nr:carbon-nitrogen hydrolase family protein [Nafulsella turpanensis]